MEQHTKFCFFLAYQIHRHRYFEQSKKAVPDPIAILTDIISAKFVETNNVNRTPIAKPK